MRSILLTGGTGFFGRALLRHWLASAKQGMPPPFVTVLARNPSSFIAQFPEFEGHSWLAFHKANILEPGTLPYKGSFSHILHAATESTFGPQLQPIARLQEIVEGTRNLLDLAVHCQVKRFLLTSSGAVYGPQPDHIASMNETYMGSPDPMQANNAYGMGKRMAEHLCTLYRHAYGIQTVVARCFAFVGPDLPLNVHFAIGNFIRDALLSQSITVNGDGSPLRSYMDQEDLAHWLLHLLQYGRSGDVYNVGSSEPISIADLARLVRDTLAPHKPVQIMGEHLENGPRNRYIPDVDKVHREFGLQLSISLRESIERTALAQFRAEG